MRIFIIILLFFPLANISANATTTCTWSNKTCGFGTCTLPTHHWEWGSRTCTTIEDPIIINSSSSGTSTIVTANDSLINFVLLMSIMITIMFSVIYLIRPFIDRYARK